MGSYHATLFNFIQNSMYISVNIGAGSRCVCSAVPPFNSFLCSNFHVVHGTNTTVHWGLYFS